MKSTKDVNKRWKKERKEAHCEHRTALNWIGASSRGGNGIEQDYVFTLGPLWSTKYHLSLFTSILVLLQCYLVEEKKMVQIGCCSGVS